MTLSIANDAQIEDFLHMQPAWSVNNGKLHREYIFHDFMQAFGFMTQVALQAERANHHPEWFNVYKTVVVDLTTHESGGISEKDFQLAQGMENIFRSNFS